jgi:hypothetical protein
VMKWFARGRLWETQEAEQADASARRRPPAGARPSGGGEGRGRDWRPGGEHKDPRDRFKITRDEKRRRFAENLHRERHDEKPDEREAPQPPRERPAGEGRGGKPPWDRGTGGGKPPWSRDRQRPAGDHERGTRPGWNPSGRPATPNKPWSRDADRDRHRESRPGWKPSGPGTGPPAPQGQNRPWPRERGSDRRQPGPEWRPSGPGPRTGGGERKPWSRPPAAPAGRAPEAPARERPRNPDESSGSRPGARGPWSRERPAGQGSTGDRWRPKPAGHRYPRPPGGWKPEGDRPRKPGGEWRPTPQGERTPRPTGEWNKERDRGNRPGPGRPRPEGGPGFERPGGGGTRHPRGTGKSGGSGGQRPFGPRPPRGGGKTGGGGRGR